VFIALQSVFFAVNTGKPVFTGKESFIALGSGSLIKIAPEIIFL
jgi:hypothetical protein